MYFGVKQIIGMKIDIAPRKEKKRTKSFKKWWFKGEAETKKGGAACSELS